MSDIVRALVKAQSKTDKKLKQTSTEIAVVVNVSPFRIKVRGNDKLVLGRNMLHMTSTVTSLLYNNNLRVGDKVMIILAKGHEEVFVVDKIM